MMLHMMTLITSFDSTKLFADDSGDGPAVLLLHGFASSASINFQRLQPRLLRENFRVISVDLRGHGQSDKPHNKEAYGAEAFLRDCSAVLDWSGVQEVHAVGYSMGAYIGIKFALADARVRSLVAAGVGMRILGEGDHQRIAHAMLVEDPSSLIDDPWAKSFRDFADLAKADRLALAAVQMGGLLKVSRDEVERLIKPVLVVAGADDLLAHDANELAKLFQFARHATSPGDHLKAVMELSFCDAVVEFLIEQSEQEPQQQRD